VKKSQDWIIIGKSEITEAELLEIKKKVHKYNIIGCNDVHKHIPFQIDYIIIQDLIFRAVTEGYNGQRIICPILSNVNRKWLKVRGVEPFYEYQKEVSPQFNKNDNKICCCPYTGVAALNYVYKQSPNKVFIYGFSSNRDLSYFYEKKEAKRPIEANEIYIKNIKELASKMNCYINKPDFDIPKIERKKL